MSQRDDMATEHAGRVKGSGDWRRTNCGWCELNGLGWDHRGNWCLNVSSGYYHCFRCETRGYLPGFEPPEDDGTVEPVPGIEPPEGYVALSEPGQAMKRARRYVLSRGISKETALRAKLGVCLRGPLAGRIIVPILDPDDRGWVGWSGRLYVPPKDERTPKYRYPADMPRARIVYNQAALARPSTKPLLVVEGVFDALPHYPDAIALLGKPSPEQVDLLCESARPLVIALDGDAWRLGYWMAQRLKLLSDVDVRHLHLPPREDPCSAAEWVREQVAKSA